MLILTSGRDGPRVYVIIAARCALVMTEHVDMIALCVSVGVGERSECKCVGVVNFPKACQLQDHFGRRRCHKHCWSPVNADMVCRSQNMIWGRSSPLTRIGGI